MSLRLVTLFDFVFYRNFFVVLIISNVRMTSCISLSSVQHVFTVCACHFEQELERDFRRVLEEYYSTSAAIRRCLVLPWGEQKRACSGDR